MKLAIDADGVAVDWDTWVYQYNHAFDSNVSIDLVREHKTYNAIVELTHFPSRNQFWRWAMAMPDFYYNLHPMKGMQGAVYELQRMGHELAIVTARPSSTREATRCWLEKHWPGPMPMLYHTSDKLSAGADIYIDDKPEVLNTVWSTVGNPNPVRAIRFEHPYNTEAMGYPAKNWRMVVDIMEVLT